MKKMRLFFAILITVMLAGIGNYALAANKTPSIVVDGIPMATDSPLIWDDETILISIEDISRCMDASHQWNEPGETTWIQKYGRTILFRVPTKEVYKNAKSITAPVPASFIGDKFYVPLRFVAENLGASVTWDARNYQISIRIGEYTMPPKRIDNQAFNAAIAYTDKGNLWILDGRHPNALPKQITDSGYAELIGWSNDGKWIAYKYAADSRSTQFFLWVASADGSNNRPVDMQPILEDPIWSPTENILAYTNWQSSTEGYIAGGNIKCAYIGDEEIRVDTLTEDESTIIPSMAWHPNGKSLAISIPRTKEHPPKIERVNLDGQRQILYAIEDDRMVDLEGLYAWAFISLKWSPDGKYIAYHLRMNSGSLTADVVETGLLDVDRKQVMELNEGLKYIEWFAFSPNSDKLAYIAGAGRDVITNKQLQVFNINNDNILDYKKENNVDAQPVWLPMESSELLFCRGLERQIIADEDIFPGVMVPGQRIYKLDQNGEIQALTMETADTADYYPSPSPKGDKFIFLRLNRFNQGSLYIQDVDKPGKEIEILRGIMGNAGYYGNYYPQWIQVRWF